MATKTTTLHLPLAHIYHLTADPNNDTGYTMEEITSLMHQHGGNHVIEATITHPIPDPEAVAAAEAEAAAAVDPSEEAEEAAPVIAEEGTEPEAEAPPAE